MDAERQRVAQEAAERAAGERRQANRRHRAAVMGKAKAAIIQITGLDDEKARELVLELAAGNVPHVVVQF